MVSTRHHPRPFPEPTLPPSRSPGTASTTSSPAKDTPPSPATETPSSTRRRSASTRRKSTAQSGSAPDASTAVTPSKSSSTSVTRSRSTRTSRSTASHFVHTPTSLSITWLLISLPLVIWDTGYVLLRPYSMPGGSLAWPLWSPYSLYGTVDYIYGFPAWNANNGFTAAQASLNVIETLAYIYYLVVIARNMDGGFWSWERGAIGKLWKEGRKRELAVKGKGVELAVLICFSSCVMTVSKTVLYALNEAWTGFANTRHNAPFDLLLLWIIPNGSWLVFPTFMIASLGKEILDGMKGIKSE